jgi:hypothetical protein
MHFPCSVSLGIKFTSVSNTWTRCQIRAFKLPFEVLSVETSSDHQSPACDTRVFVFRNREGHYCLVIRLMLWERKVWAEENPERVADSSV